MRNRGAIAVATLFAGLMLGSCAPPPPDVIEAPVGWIDEGPLLTVHDGSHTPARLGAITRSIIDSVEVVVLRFESSMGLAPAPAPSWILLGRSRAVLRVICPLDSLLEGPPSTWTDTLFTGPGLVASAYVLRTLEGHLAVDLHLAAPVLARAHVGGPDSAFVIELRRGGPPMPGLALASRRPNIVLLEPREGSASSLLAVEGYARTFESNVLIQVRGAVAPIDTFTTAAGGVDLWGEFRLELPHAAAAETVRVGDADMESGALRLIEVVRRR